MSNFSNNLTLTDTLYKYIIVVNVYNYDDTKKG